jgi:hypothetical protein
MVPPSVTIAPPDFDLLSAAGIGGLAVFVAALFVAMIARGAPGRLLQFGALVALVMLATAWAATRGLLARFDIVPPPMAVMIALVLASGLALGLSPLGLETARAVPLVALVGLQSFRLPLELVMHRAGTLGIMPPELSYGGYNFDIVTGTGAAVLAGLLWAGRDVPRAALWLWNIWGFWCLAVIAVIAIATSPMVRLFGDDPRHVNTWVLYFPYVWLPVVLVTVALAGHVIVARALRMQARPSAD